MHNYALVCYRNVSNPPSWLLLPLTTAQLYWAQFCYLIWRILSFRQKNTDRPIKNNSLPTFGFDEIAPRRVELRSIAYKAIALYGCATGP